MRRPALLRAALVPVAYGLLFAVFFSPVLFQSRLFESDGQLSAFFAPVSPWSDLWAGGWPVAADTASYNLYPLRILLSHLPHGFDLFVVSAYTAAGTFTYGYVHAVTSSRLAAFVAGAIYGSSGFMIGHLPHTSMIHAAAWLPLVMWALERLRRDPGVGWFSVASLAVALAVLAGHLQIFAYTMLLAGVYVVSRARNAHRGALAYVGRCAAAVAVGVALAAFQLLPTLELTRLTFRAHMDFHGFVSYSLPLSQLPTLVFPYLFGGSPDSFYTVPYFGTPGMSEYTGYVGVLSLLLAAVGLAAHPDRGLVRFWSGWAILALLLAVGGGLPWLAEAMYQVPVINKFRVPSRHLLEVTFAVAVLAGTGVEALRRRRMSGRTVGIVVGASGVALVLALLVVGAAYGHLVADAQARGIAAPPMLRNPAVWVPVTIWVIAALSVLGYQRLQGSRVGSLGLVAVLVVDLASFGWFYSWNASASADTVLTPPAYAQKYRALLEASHQRFLPIPVVENRIPVLPPDLSRLYRVPSASWYGPLLIRRYGELSGVDVFSRLSPRALTDRNHALDLLAVRYVFAPSAAGATTKRAGIPWYTEVLPLSLGTGCPGDRPGDHAASTRAVLRMRRPVHATRVAIVTTMRCAASVPDGTTVLTLALTGPRHQVAQASMQAGRHTADWAYDCADVSRRVRHGRANVFETWPAERPPSLGPACRGQDYVATFPIGEGDYVDLELRWTNQPGGIDIRRISLLDDETGETYPVTLADMFLHDRRRWRHVEAIGGAEVYENLRALPRAWLVPEVRSVDGDDARKAIHEGELPDGTVYEPEQTALVEDGSALSASRGTGHAEVLSVEDSAIEVKTSSTSSMFLVVSSTYHPGWQATVDGEPTRVLRTNYALKGVFVPAGTHLVRLAFVPVTLYLGLGISALAGLLLLLSVARRAHATHTRYSSQPRTSGRGTACRWPRSRRWAS